MRKSQQRIEAERVLATMNLTKYENDPEKAPFMVDQDVADMIGCSRGLVYTIRKEMLGLDSDNPIRQSIREVNNYIDNLVINSDEPLDTITHIKIQIGMQLSDEEEKQKHLQEEAMRLKKQIDKVKQGSDDPILEKIDRILD